MKLVTMILMTIFIVHADGAMKLEFARVCFEMGGTIDEEGYCDMENADVRLLRDLNITDWKW